MNTYKIVMQIFTRKNNISKINKGCAMYNFFKYICIISLAQQPQKKKRKTLIMKKGNFFEKTLSNDPKK
jgi:hypothetical protein